MFYRMMSRVNKWPKRVVLLGDAADWSRDFINFPSFHPSFFINYATHLLGEAHGDLHAVVGRFVQQHRQQLKCQQLVADLDSGSPNECESKLKNYQMNPNDFCSLITLAAGDYLVVHQMSDELGERSRDHLIDWLIAPECHCDIVQSFRPMMWSMQSRRTCSARRWWMD